MAKQYSEGVLFPDFDSLITKPPMIAYDESIRLRVIRGAISPYVIGNYEMEGELHFPKAAAVNITLPERIIPFDEARKTLDTQVGIHHFMYDDRICTVWTRPLPYILRYRHFCCVLGVDFSVYNEEEMIPISLMNMIKSRYLICTFQKYGIPTIPLFTFGHPALERWWYDGIPEYSQIAICNVSIGKTQEERELRQYAINGLIKHKHPTTLVVYGRPLAFDPGVEAKFYEGKLSKFKKAYRHEDN